jgi:hypothetical protein
MEIARIEKILTQRYTRFLLIVIIILMTGYIFIKKENEKRLYGEIDNLLLRIKELNDVIKYQEIFRQTQYNNNLWIGKKLSDLNNKLPNLKGNKIIALVYSSHSSISKRKIRDTLLLFSPLISKDKILFLTDSININLDNSGYKCYKANIKEKNQIENPLLFLVDDKDIIRKAVKIFGNEDEQEMNMLKKIFLNK